MFDHHNYGGMYAWQFPANFLVLRVISYCVDYFDAVEYHSTRQKVKKMLKLPKEGQVSSSIQGGNYPENTENPDNFELVPEFHRPVEEYENVIHFLSYLLYTPLYMAGPIISYNAFIYYSHYPNAIKESKYPMVCIVLVSTNYLSLSLIQMCWSMLCVGWAVSSSWNTYQTTIHSLLYCKLACYLTSVFPKWPL